MNDNIFRIIKLKEDGVKELFIFHYDLNNDSFKKDVTNNKDKYKTFIGEKNYENIKDNDEIKIYLINENINLDDNIETIKKKIINVMDNVSFEEIYLFYSKFKTYNNYEIYEILSQNNNIVITRERLIQYLLNFIDIDIENLDLNNDIYEYDDIINLNINNKEKLIKDILGQRFFIEKKYPITINPFDLLIFDEFIENTGSDILSTQNKKLLLEYDNLYENNIYLCLASDVLEYINENNLSQETSIKLYYPFLREKNITSLEELNEKKQELLNKNKKLINENFKTTNNIINLFNSIYETKKKELNYIKKGIKYLNLN